MKTNKTLREHLKKLLICYLLPLVFPDDKKENKNDKAKILVMVFDLKIEKEIDELTTELLTLFKDEMDKVIGKDERDNGIEDMRLSRRESSNMLKDYQRQALQKLIEK